MHTFTTVLEKYLVPGDAAIATYVRANVCSYRKESLLFISQQYHTTIAARMSAAKVKGV